MADHPQGDARFVMARLQVEWDLLQRFMAEATDVDVEPLDFTWGEEALPYKYRFTLHRSSLGRPKGKPRLQAFPLSELPIVEQVSFDVFLSEAYPVVKPEIYAVSDIWHPNVSPKDGFVCYVNDSTYDLTVHLIDMIDMLAGIVSWQDIYENPDDFQRRVQIGDYLNPDAAGWAFHNPDEIDQFRHRYFGDELTSITDGEPVVPVLEPDAE